MEYTPEQLKAAYALNLCTVSVSQIIDYDDVNVMEQEYEAILNNLNLEQMPKDEALLTILKQIMDTITYFRIMEVEKKFLDEAYQQKMKNAIWSAVPNIGLLIAGGNPVTMAISLASQVGIGYLNYRKAKAEINSEADRERWELERSAIEQFNGLRRELFDTAWRLSAAYHFPDQLRLTERQIKQYNAILMDTDLIRKYERLSAIQDAFLAYPPFWYYYGNTANAISRSEGLALSGSTRAHYRQLAKEHFLQYRSSNQYGLLREDPISASCALELVDLLDLHKDEAFIRELIPEAIARSGRANDVLQLASMAYLKLNDGDSAAAILRQLVNEQYNTILNAQLLSSIYVKKFVKTGSDEVKAQYEILKAQVGGDYLYPIPLRSGVSLESCESTFLARQRQILKDKYTLTLDALEEKYSIQFGRLIPPARSEAEKEDAYFLSSDSALQVRKHEFAKIFSSSRKSADYAELLQDAGIPYSILDLLNGLFDSCSALALMTEPLQAKLAGLIRAAIVARKDTLNDISTRIQDGNIDFLVMEKLLSLKLSDFTAEYFQALREAVYEYVKSRTEMQDFTIAEENLVEFCQSNGLPDPAVLFGKDGCEACPPMEIAEPRFGIELLEGKAVSAEDEISTEQKMLALIQKAIPRIVLNRSAVEFYTSEDPRKERYFRSNEKLKASGSLMANTLAILDHKTQKGICDLIFTSEGIVPVRGGAVKKSVSYKGIALQTVPFAKAAVLNIDGRFESPALDLQSLYQLAQALAPLSHPIYATSSGSAKSHFQLPFEKK